MRRAAFLAAMSMLGCRPSGPPISVECKTDGDCATTMLTPKGEYQCCDQCAAVAGSESSILAFVLWCTKRAPNPSCPKLDCPNADTKVACENGACVARSTPP